MVVEERGCNVHTFVMNKMINDSFMKLSKRAETSDLDKLVATFVDVGPLFVLLSSKDHQIIYGRRGTGKTHAFGYLSQRCELDGDVPVLIDLRVVGSATGLYNDPSTPTSQRATLLLIDTLTAIHEALFRYFLAHAEDLNLAETGPILDSFAAELTNVSVVGQVESEQRFRHNAESNISDELGLKIGAKGPAISCTVGSTDKRVDEDETKLKVCGTYGYRVRFGALTEILKRLALATKGRQIWVLLDEWSSVPMELQPFLADLLRRSIFPVQGYTVKLAAIEQRSRFNLKGERGDYVGIEVGADAAVDINLDDFMVFDNDPGQATRFFGDLLFKHFMATENADAQFVVADDLVRVAFTQVTAFEEFVRATEGVPRDAINIISLCAQRALNSQIAVEHVRYAARNWYQRDKETAVKSNAEAHALLHWVIDEVIGNRHARAFLLKSHISHPLIDDLFDARVLHILKRNISAHDQPGVRYDAYKLDYGCYVDLINTARAPRGLLPADGAYSNVPPDDYRAIRRAILELERFKERSSRPF